MSRAIWSPELTTGLPAMDELQLEFCETLTQLSAAPDQEFSEAYNCLVEKAEQTFAAEEQWMEEIDCPALRTHREQHARVLGTLHKVHGEVMGGNLTAARKVVGHLLPEWFYLHATTMNMALALAVQTANAAVPLKPATPVYA
jgi:hemerythrin